MQASRLRRSVAVLLGLAMLATACGGDDDDDGAAAPDDATEDTAGDGDTGDDTATDDGGDATDDGGDATDDGDDGDTGEATDDGDTGTSDAGSDGAPAGTLRMVEFSPVTTFDPAGAQTAQSAYLYPVYDTLLLQDASYAVQPNLATEWSQPEPNVWEFTVRTDVVFHDGATFDAQVAADNIERSAAFEGNPNASTFAGLVSATAPDAETLRVEFDSPKPQFLLQMTMVPGMMVSPNAFEDDLTRNPAGSGPWVWDDGQSQAGVTEVYTLFEDYWDPAKQGVESVEVTAVADNNARLNAGVTGDAEIVATLRDAQIDTAEGEGWEVVAVQNYFPLLIIGGRDGTFDEELTDERVRQAIGYSIDREAYVDAIHAGRGSSGGGVYPPDLADWYAPELDDTYGYDPDRARELLAEAGYPDGITVSMPVMPAIQPHMEIVVQMLGSTGITVDLIQINNGELGPRSANHEWDIHWNRALLFHPAADLFGYGLGPRYNHSTEDSTDLDEMMVEAASAATQEEAKEIYTEVTREMIERGMIIPLGHGGQNGAYDPERVTAPVMGLNMQAPMPYGVRLID